MPDPGAQLWTTDAVAPADRVAYWRDAICAVYVRLQAAPVGDGPFGGSVLMQSWQQVQLSNVVASGQRVVRQPDDSSADCLVSLQVAGTGRVTQDGRTAVLAPGDLALYDPTRPYALDFDAAFEQIVVQFPRSELLGRGVDIRSVAARRCTGAAGLGDVTGALVRSVFANDAAVPAASRGLLAGHVLDCLAATLSASTGGVVGQDAGRTAARQAVLSYVEAHLTDPGLSVTAVARALRRSPRSVQKLFPDDGLARRIRSARVDRATRALVDPLRAHHSISRIAADHGYADAAHFARVFRERHGCAPSDFRRGKPA